MHRKRGQPGDCTLLARRRGDWRCRLAAGQRRWRRPDSHRLPALLARSCAAQRTGNVDIMAPASCLPGGEPGGVSGGAVLEVLPCSVADCAPGCGGSAQCPAPRAELLPLVTLSWLWSARGAGGREGGVEVGRRLSLLLLSQKVSSQRGRHSFQLLHSPCATCDTRPHCSRLRCVNVTARRR